MYSSKYHRILGSTLNGVYVMCKLKRRDKIGLLESWGEVLSSRVISETYQAYQAPYSCGLNDQ